MAVPHREEARREASPLFFSSILSTYAVQKELRAGQLHALAVSDLHCDRDMYVVRDRRRVLSLPAQQFLIFLETHPVASAMP